MLSQEVPVEALQEHPASAMISATWLPPA